MRSLARADAINRSSDNFSHMESYSESRNKFYSYCQKEDQSIKDFYDELIQRYINMRKHESDLEMDDNPQYSEELRIQFCTRILFIEDQMIKWMISRRYKPTKLSKALSIAKSELEYYLDPIPDELME